MEHGSTIPPGSHRRRAALRGDGWDIAADLAGPAPAVQTNEDIADAVTRLWIFPTQETPEVRAPAGHELVVTRFRRASPNPPAPREPVIPHPITIRIGEREVRLPTLQEPGLVVSAPAGESVTLHADDGRPQSFDP